MTTAVVFDLDGTLVDTTPDIAAALNRTLERRGLGPLTEELVHGLTGYGADELVRRAFAEAGEPLDDDAVAPQTRRYLEAYAERPVERSVVHGDAEETLAALAARGAALGVCTNKDTALAWTVLRHLGLPEHLQAVLGALEAPAEAAVYVGDNAIDVETAAVAGVRCAIVAWGTAPTTVGPTWARLSRFGELVELLEDGAELASDRR